MRRAKPNQHDHHDDSRECERDGQAAGMLGSKPIRESEQEQHANGGQGNVLL